LAFELAAHGRTNAALNKTRDFSRIPASTLGRKLSSQWVECRCAPQCLANDWR
jgi:hypothetical protein